MTELIRNVSEHSIASTADGRPEATHALDAMAARVGRLEKSCRRWRLAGLALATCLAVVVGAAAANRPEAIEAERFVLKGPDGAVLASWEVRPDHTPGLQFFDAAGKVRLSLSTGADGAPGVNLFGPNEGVLGALAVRSDGTPGLCLADDRGTIRVSLDVGPAAVSGVNVFGESGKLRTAMAVRPDGTPAVGLFDENGAIKRSFETEPDPARATSR